MAAGYAGPDRALLIVVERVVNAVLNALPDGTPPLTSVQIEKLRHEAVNFVQVLRCDGVVV